MKSARDEIWEAIEEKMDMFIHESTLSQPGETQIQRSTEKLTSELKNIYPLHHRVSELKPQDHIWIMNNIINWQSLQETQENKDVPFKLN